MSEHPLGRQGTSVNQSPTGSDLSYPFLVTPEALPQLLADFFYAGPDPVALPVRLAWLSGFGADAPQLTEPLPAGWTVPTLTNAQDLLLVDANEQVIFDSTDCLLEVQAWGDRLQVLSWRNTTTQQICRLVQHTAWPEHITPIAYPSELSLASDQGQLDPRTCVRFTAPVTAITVDGEPIPEGEVEFAAGYNVQMDADPETRQIVFQAEPGLGLGKAPGCEEGRPAYVYSIGGAKPDAAGNITIAASECLSMRPDLLPTDDPEVLQLHRPGRIRIYNDCKACCDCNTISNTAQGVRKLFEEGEVYATDLNAISQKTNELLVGWNDYVGCLPPYEIQQRLEIANKQQITLWGSITRLKPYPPPVLPASPTDLSRPSRLRITFIPKRAGVAFQPEGAISVMGYRTSRPIGATQPLPGSAWPIYDLLTRDLTIPLDQILAYEQPFSFSLRLGFEYWPADIELIAIITVMHGLSAQHSSIYHNFNHYPVPLRRIWEWRAMQTYRPDEPYPDVEAPVTEEEVEDWEGFPPFPPGRITSYHQVFNIIPPQS